VQVLSLQKVIACTEFFSVLLVEASNKDRRSQLSGEAATSRRRPLRRYESPKPTFQLSTFGRPKVQVYFLLGIKSLSPTFGQGGIKPPLPTSTM
jgi:hypothetical protein